MPWTVVVNPAAGRGRTERLLPQLRTRALSIDLVDDLRVSVSPDDARDIAQKAAAKGNDLMAIGGDGLVGMFAGVAAESGRTLAMAPTGAGNDFAATLGYDVKNPLRAFDVIEGGTDRVVDLGRVNGVWYTGVSYTGFDAEANRWANTVRRMRGTPLYVAAALRTLARYRPRTFTINVDDDEHILDAWMVSVGNNTRYAGGMHITPNALMDDGLLDVCVVGPLSIPKFLVAFPKVFSGRHVENPAVTTLRGAKISVTTADPSDDLEVWADGERVGPLPASIHAVSNALTVRLPG